MPDPLLMTVERMLNENPALRKLAKPKPKPRESVENYLRRVGSIYTPKPARGVRQPKSLPGQKGLFSE
ncbi:hypothetical protein [Botrimarina sp.]|uniref:hypothetical protein n=1 Tax=Botrimarina sp. TaxID=2795802 RepID=UPI0032EFEF82